MKYLLAAVLLFTSNVFACTGVIIGASNEKGLDTGLQLGEAINAIAGDQCNWINLAQGGATTNAFVDQAREAVTYNPDFVIVGLSGELFYNRAIELLHNNNRIINILQSTDVYFFEYPEQAIETTNPIHFARSIEFELANLRGYNTHLGYQANDNENIDIIKYPQYVTMWYLTGRENDDGIHADTATTMGMAAEVLNRLRNDGHLR